MGNKTDEFILGQSAEFTVTVTEEIIILLAEASGDRNPVHLDEEYAAGTVFGKRIAHGLLCLGMISNLIGNRLPGPGSILVSQEIKYCKPVYIDDCIKATVIIKEIIALKNKFIMYCVCENQNGDIVLEGSAVVKMA